MDFEFLFEPFSLGKTRLPTRIVMPGMQRGRCEDGHLMPEMIDYYARRVRGGAGLIVGEGCCVEHWSASGNPNLPRIAPDTIGTWARCADGVHEAGGAMLLQLSHPGAIRTNAQFVLENDKPSLGASGLYTADKANGRAATRAELDEIRDTFAEAAMLAMQAGMDGVELHACHGFFLDEFLWADTNRREDEYGGATIAERATYPATVLAAMRDAMGPDAILSIRISQWKEVDYHAQNVTSPEELGDLLAALQKAGASVLHPSCRRFYQPAFPGSDLSLAGWCRKLSDLPVITVGSVGLTTDVMNSLVGTPGEGIEEGENFAELRRRFDGGEFDLVAVGRSLIADPEWPEKVREGRFDAIRPFRKEDLGKALEMEPQMIKDVHDSQG